MSTAVMPVLAGMGYPVVRTPVWDTDVQKAISGKQNRLAYFTYPLYEWSADVNVLRSLVSPDDFQTLIGFFNARQGSFDSFLYTDADDNSVTGQAIATSNGTTTTFQLVKSFGGFVEPVLAPNMISNIYLAGVSIPSAGYSAATNGALTQTSAGSLGAATYYVRSTWVTESGETSTSVESSLAVSASHVLNVAAPSSAPAGAIGWNVYVSTSTATETRQNSTPIALGTAWVEPTTGLINTGAAFPLTNTTGWLVSNWGTSAPGIITFAGAPASGVAVTADFSYYYPCRFLADKFDFSLDFQGIYSVKKLNWGSVKN
jgi:uncharacterized protein (TIGR02217 family)